VSVINKMLRDLDSRQTSATPVNAAFNQGRDLVRGTSILISTASPRKVGWMTFAATALVVVGLVGGLTVWWQTQGVAKAPQQGQAVHMPPVQPAPVSVVMPAVVVAAAPVAVAVPMLPPLPAAAKPGPPAATIAMSAPVQATSSVPAATPKLRAANEMAIPTPSKVDLSAKSTQAATNAAAAIAPAPVPVATVQRQSAALDALAQAQGLWTAGARDSATDVLREAIALAERQGSGASAALVPLARELARMLIAENQNRQALDLLTRLEPALSSQADLWAVRGNAAQRLGHHPEAVSAYAMALKLRAGEPRWMLGGAISLAIQGQLAEAGELTEQARSRGALSSELRAYLRQLGVVIRD
jgi:MSHA biogenesis protein MshN